MTFLQLTLMGKIRLLVADWLEQKGHVIRDTSRDHFLWVDDFPLFLRKDDESGETNSMNQMKKASDFIRIFHDITPT